MPKAKPRRSSLGANPLDSLVPTKGRRAVAAVARQETPTRVPKERATFHLPVSLMDELRNAVVALSGPPLRLTLAKLAEEALGVKLAELQKGYNRGKPFPPREADLVGGRPVK